MPYLLKKLGTQITHIESEIKESLYAIPRVQGGQQFLSNDSQKVLQKAESIIKDWGDDFIALEHLLYALLTSKNKVSKLLKSQGLNPKEVQQAIKELRKGSKVQSASAEDSYNALNKYARNLNQLAKDNKLDPVIEETMKSVESYKFYRAVPKTTLYSLVNQALVKLPSLKD